MVAVRRLSDLLQKVAQRHPGLPVLAMWWMHLCHPLRGIQAELVRDTRLSFRDVSEDAVQLWWQWFVGLARGIAYGGYLLLGIARLRFMLRRELRELRSQSFAVVARSCCYGSDWRTDGTDFYYGNLQVRLAEHGVSTLLLCSNISSEAWRTFARRHTRTSGLCRVPDLALISPFAVAAMVGQQIVSALGFARMARRESDPGIRKVFRLASLEALAPATTMTGLSVWVGRAAARLWHPRVVMTLYEGYGWEKCVWYGVNTTDPSCTTVGYQHTAIFRESLAIIEPASRGAWSVPDVVLGLGLVPLEMIRAGHARFGTTLIPFGSFRYQPTTAQHPADLGRRTVLVTPVGHRPEVKTLFAFASRCAQRLPHYTFILRCHPEVPMAIAKQLIDVDLTSVPNVVLSNRSIEDDFQRASVLLYRGSSSAFYAVLQGLLPIYADIETEMDRDPLFQLERWRQRCASVEGFVQVLAQHERTSEGALTQEWQAAAQYVKDYTGPVTDDRIEAFLRAVDLRSKQETVSSCIA